MSTRCMIGRANADGTITGIYCHYDGYLERVGRMARARAVVALTLAPIVTAWASGDDVAVTAALTAWERADCELCALAACSARDASATCAGCAACEVAS